MKKITIIVLVAFIALFATNAFAGGTDVLKFAKFNALNSNKYSATFDETGKIRTISANASDVYSKKSVKRSNEDIVNAAIKFLEKNSELIGGIEAKNLRVENVSASENITHILFAHYFKNKKVLDSEISVHMNNGLEVVMVNNSLLPVSQTSVLENVISDKQAFEIAKKHFNVLKLRNKVRTAEVVYNKDKVAYDAIVVEIPSLEPLGDFITVVNAGNGSVVESYDIMMHADTLGSIYMYNPLKGDVVKEPLLNLTSNGKGLIGKWAKIVNEDTVSAVLDASGNFVFEPNDTHFDEVNAYYHTNKVHDFFSQYGFTGLDRSMKVTVHYGTAYDNAYFSPMEGAIALGDGSRLNDLAKEESVIYHEYTHAVTNAMVSMPYSAESGAINEAFSDYFACTMTEDPVVGEWAMAKMNKPFIRNMDNKTHYPEDIQHEVHYDSNIYGGALWDLRKALGANITDKITHFSRNYLKGIKNQKFTDGVNALIAADKELLRGLDVDTIKKVFEARGIKIKSTEINNNALKFDALNGDKDAKQMLEDIENGNIK